MKLNLRRLLASAIDPDLNDELADLRDRGVEAHLTIQAQRTLLRDLQASQVVEKAIAAARIRDAEVEARKARADVARLLKASAQCAHEHHNT